MAWHKKGPDAGSGQLRSADIRDRSSVPLCMKENRASSSFDVRKCSLQSALPVGVNVGADRGWREKLKRLSARSISALTKPGRHSDGVGLYLVIDTSGAKRWAFIFRWGGKLKEMGLGGLSAVSLADARDRAGEARALLLARGSNPIETRRAAEGPARRRQALERCQRFGSPFVARLWTKSTSGGGPKRLRRMRLRYATSQVKKSRQPRF